MTEKEWAEVNRKTQEVSHPWGGDVLSMQKLEGISDCHQHPSYDEKASEGIGSRPVSPKRKSWEEVGDIVCY